VVEEETYHWNHYQ